MILRNAAARHGRRALAGSVSRSSVRNASTDGPPPPDREPPASQLAFSPQETSAWVAKMAQEQPETKTRQREAPLVRSSRRKQSKFAQESILQLSRDGTTKHKGDRWAKPTEIDGQTFSVKQQWETFKKLQHKTKKLGSSLQKKYDPSAMLMNPPMPEDITLEMLMAAQTHMGHNKAKWNPANAKYIYGVREGTHIISLETTAAHLRRASRVVEEVAYHGGIILFVGTRKGQMEIVYRAAQMSGAYQLFTKWAPGTITNRDVMLEGHQTMVVNDTDEQLPDFDKYDNKSRPLMPDLVVCLNPQENYTMLYECGLATIPTIGIIDTDTDPTWVTYGIPANDDSLRSVAVITGVLGRAGERGQQRRMDDSASGAVPWQTPAALRKHMDAEIEKAQAHRKRFMQMQAHQAGLDEEELELMEKEGQKLERRKKQQKKPAKEMNEDAMLDILSQGQKSGRTGRKASVVDQLDAALKSQESQSEKLEAALTAASTFSPTDSIELGLSAQFEAAADLASDIKAAAGEDVLEAEEALREPRDELSPAAKKRKELEALFSGKKL